MSSDLFVISAPSGTGKTTLAKRLLSEVPGIDFSVSHTTRPKRSDERDGADYHFVSPEEFERMVGAGDFLEWARVHGHSYGTGVRHVDQSLSRGRDVLLDIDTQGAASVKRLRPEAVLIFIMPPDFETLKRRLQGRAMESSEEILRRLAHAREEIQRYTEYDYAVINDSVEEALRCLKGIVAARRCRTSRQEETCRRIAAGFRAR